MRRHDQLRQINRIIDTTYTYGAVVVTFLCLLVQLTEWPPAWQTPVNTLAVVYLLVAVCVGLIQVLWWLLGRVWAVRSSPAWVILVSVVGLVGLVALFWVMPKMAGQDGQITVAMCLALALAISYRFTHRRR